MKNTLSRDIICISRDFIDHDLVKVNGEFMTLPIVKHEDSNWCIEHDTVARTKVLDEVQPEPNDEIRSFHSKIAGVSFRQDIVTQLKEGDELLLEREPGNTYDPNAIKILNKDKVQIGYVKKELAEKLSRDIDGGKKFKVSVSQLTGTADKQTKGVNILFEVV